MGRLLVVAIISRAGRVGAVEAVEAVVTGAVTIRALPMERAIGGAIGHP